MVLTHADRQVMSGADSNLLYVRFCDDMVIVHPDRSACAAALERYLDAVAMRKLPVHPICREGFVYGPGFYGEKSKGPFVWERAKIGDRNVSPWVSFLGNEIGYDGGVRIRRETVARHAQKLRAERGRFVQRVAPVLSGDYSRLKGVPTVWRLEALANRYCSHIVAKGIGFMREGRILEESLCWAVAFPHMTTTATCRRQMRGLDALRDRLLRPFNSDLTQRGGGRAFFGRPFSYYGYLLRLTRPVQPIPGKGKPTAERHSPRVSAFRFYAGV